MRFISRIWTAMMAAAPVRTWAMFGAGVVLTALAIFFALIIWRGGWPVARAEQQLWYLGCALLGTLLLLAMVIAALTSARLSGKVGSAELNLDTADEPQPIAKVTTTTTVEPGDK